MKKVLFFVFIILCSLFTLCSCGNVDAPNTHESVIDTTKEAAPSTRSNSETNPTESGRSEKIRCTFDDGSVGYINDLTDTITTREFVGLLPMEITLSDWEGREYYLAKQLSYDQKDAQTTYAPGEFTYWCGGWITAYYDTNDDTVIEAGSVVIGMMDEMFLSKLKNANGKSVTVRFDTEEQIPSTGEIRYSSWSEVPENKYDEKTIEIDYNGQTIWGIAYIPNAGKDKYPLVICSHGLGGNYRSCMEYAELLASHGIATYCFDFRGGGGNKSDGKTTEMSLITEATDLQTVIAAAKDWDFVDCDKIALLGESQGGAASAIAAARSAADVNGLILCYPAFLVHDAVHELYTSLDQVPASFHFNWITVGRPYVADVWDYDVYSEIGNYKKPVLLMHGDRDSIVPVSYAEQAEKVYSDVEYYVISGGGHGFYGNALDSATNHILRYLQTINML